MVSDSLNPYEIDEEELLDYTFITKDGIKYHASFYSVEPLYPEFVDTYSFSIEPEDKRSHPMDRRIAITIAEILKRFFAVNTNAMIMVCDSTDGKEFKRRKRCILPTFGYLPYQGWVFLFIFPTLKHFPVNTCIFRKKSISLPQFGIK